MRPAKNQEKKGGKGGKNARKNNVAGAKTALVKKATKAKKKIVNPKAAKDEIEDLIDGAANGQATNGSQKVTLTPTRSGRAVAKKQLRKVRSIVGMQNAHSKLQESPATPTPGRGLRSSSRITAKSTPKALEMSFDEVAKEANESVNTANGSVSNGPGLFQRTMSKIWRVPASEVANGSASYDSINTQRNEASGRGSCVIS